ncbi:MAG: aconitase X catalytic domain-containing protein [Alphaproteobacteria bacterium]|nr:aconitase X catalytic domain-containing protein [Alphaproteobacteria bacterium]
MRLTDEERAMLAGEMGEPRRWAISHQIAVGEFFDAADFVPVSQAHIMADTESLGEAGVRFLERLAAAPERERRVRVPTITDPRGIDFAVYRRLGQSEWMAALEQRAITALRAFGVLMTDTCINYQTITPPVRGDHLAYGDTGVVIYSNSVFGARSNFEGGPSALAAGLTGRTPRYGYHLDECWRATKRFRLAETPRDLAEWGAVGGIVGEACGPYWEVPVVEGIDTVPGSDALKHFGTAAASFGSVALFHMPGITAEDMVFTNTAPLPAVTIGRAEIEAFLARFAAPGDKLDVVVFGAPQLSLFEIEAVARALDGRRIHPDTTLLVTTSPEIKHAADRMGLTRRIENAGAVVAAGICFYQSYAREIAEVNHWTRLMTNSVKLVNIIGGYGYRPTLASLERCVDSAVAGRVL